MSINQGFSYEQSYDLPKTEKKTSRSCSEPSVVVNPDIISHQPTSARHSVSSTAPWTYVPSGSIPLQRQDFHTSMKSLNINSYSSVDMDNTPDTEVMPDESKRRVSTMSQISITSLPTVPTPGTSAFGSRDWSSGLFDSCKKIRKTQSLSATVKSFFRDCLCVPCMMCDISKSLGDKALLPFIPGTGAAIRFKVRILGGIQGTIADDCVVVSCCCPCAVCQMYREIDDIGLATT